MNILVDSQGVRHMEDIKLEKEKALERFALTIQEDRIAKDIKRQGLSGTPGGKTLIKKTLTNEESFIKFLDSWIEKTQSKKKRKVKTQGKNYKVKNTR